MVVVIGERVEGRLAVGARGVEQDEGGERPLADVLVDVLVDVLIDVVVVFDVHLGVSFLTTECAVTGHSGPYGGSVNWR